MRIKYGLAVIFGVMALIFATKAFGGVQNVPADVLSLTADIEAESQARAEADAGKAPLNFYNEFGDAIVVLLLGQSNMKGMGTGYDALDDELLNGVSNAYINEWQDGVDFDPTNLVKVSGRNFGPELAGLRSLQKLTGKTVVGIKVTYGGTAIGTWLPVTPYYEGTNNYYTNIAFQIAQTQAIWTNIGPVDVVWKSHGESDADSMIEATNYYSNLTNLFSSLEIAGTIPTNCPIIMGGFTKALSEGTYTSRPYSTIVMSQKDLFCATRGNAWHFYAGDLTDQGGGTSVHFDNNGLIQYGERFAAETMRALNLVDNDSIAAREIVGHKVQAQVVRTKDFYLSGVEVSAYVDDRVNDIVTPSAASTLESALAHVHPVISYLGTNYTRPLPLTAAFYKSNYSGSDTWLDAAYTTTTNAGGTVWLDASAVNTNIWTQTNGVAAYPSIVDATNSYYFSFAESASNSLYCSIPVARFGNQTNAFFMKTSIMLDAIPASAKTIVNSRIDGNRSMGLTIGSSGLLNFTMRRTNYFNVVSSTAILTGIWYDVVAAWTPSNGTMSMTVNGVEGITNGTSFAFSANTLSIGSGVASVTNSAGFKMRYFVLDIKE